MFHQLCMKHNCESMDQDYHCYISYLHVAMERNLDKQKINVISCRRKMYFISWKETENKWTPCSVTTFTLGAEIIGLFLKEPLYKWGYCGNIKTRIDRIKTWENKLYRKSIFLFFIFHISFIFYDKNSVILIFSNNFSCIDKLEELPVIKF